MAPIDFYYVDISPPCRAVMLTAKSLGVPLNKKVIDLFSGEQKKPEFVAINPQHTVPTIVDGKFKLWESRAIQAYLVGKYAKNDNLYPRDVSKRAVVDQLLYFDATTLFSRLVKYIADSLFDQGPLDPVKLENFLESVGYLDEFIKGKKFAAADHITIADHSLMATITQMEPFKIDVSKYKNVSVWMKRCKEEMVGYQAENQQGVDHLAQFLATKSSSSK